MIKFVPNSKANISVGKLLRCNLILTWMSVVILRVCCATSSACRVSLLAPACALLLLFCCELILWAVWVQVREGSGEALCG